MLRFSVRVESLKELAAFSSKVTESLEDCEGYDYDGGISVESIPTPGNSSVVISIGKANDNDLDVICCMEDIEVYD